MPAAAHLAGLVLRGSRPARDYRNPAEQSPENSQGDERKSDDPIARAGPGRPQGRSLPPANERLLLIVVRCSSDAGGRSLLQLASAI